MAVTMHDVARHAGVSQRTVSNVVTGATPVAPITRARVEASIEALGYRPNTSARQLRGGRTHTVTLALPDLVERHFADLAQAVVVQARDRGLQVLVELTGGDRQRELAVLRGEGVLTDGVLMSSVALTPDDTDVPAPRFPLVIVGDRPAGDAIAHVAPDDAAATADAVGHLLKAGRRAIVLLGDRRPDFLTAQRRFDGYRRALAREQLPLSGALLVDAAWTFDEGRRAVSALIASGEPFDAIFGMNDTVALGALASLRDAGLAIPDEVAVAGFDNTREAARATPALTSVGPSTDDIAAAALAALASAPAAPGDATVVVPHQLIERGSTTG